MDVSVLNAIPSQLIKGEITKEKAVEVVLKFIQDYPQLFGLHKFDEDFRSEVMLSLISKKDRLVPIYKENGEYIKKSSFLGGGDFFYHVYWLVNSIMNTKKRNFAKSQRKETVLYIESRIHSREDEREDGREGISSTEEVYKEKSPTLKKITTEKTECSKTAVNYKLMKNEDFKKIFEPVIKSRRDKKFLVLAIKSSFYLTDDIISRLSKYYQIKKEDLYDAVQYIKNSLQEKFEKRNYAAQRRNRAYYYKLNYESQLENLDSNDFEEKIKRNTLISKYEIHNLQWQKLNTKLQSGGPYVRPSNKEIASFLGICERQVSYYVASAKKEANSNQSYDFSDDIYKDEDF